MCGIAGLAGAGAADTEALQRMAGAMIHRGPDGQGIWHDQEVGLAFRRLSIIDLHERSNQPLHFGGLHLVFNGEIYNYVELRGDLRRLGHRFVTEGDAEVLLHAWAEWGERALDRLNGMFAFAVWDAAANRMTLATDRFAEKPLFVHERAGRLAFASDVRALRAADASIGIPDRAATDRFLALGTMPSLPATFFADVRRLPPAHVAHWDGRRLDLQCWWHPAQVDVPARPVDATARLRELLTDSVALRLRSDVPVGTSLSGGVDSSAIVALSSELAGDHRRHAFTATFPGFGRDEWTYASAVAAATGVIEHHSVRPELDDLLEDLGRLVADQEEPFGSTSIYAQWRVMRAAREAGVVVMLDGQGADELFGGYVGIQGWALRSRGPAAALVGVVRDRDLAGPVALAYSAHRAPRSIAARYRLRRASPYVGAAMATAAACHESGPPDWDASGSPLRRELLNQAFRTSLPHLCRFADRDGMAFGVEVRLPFLDPRVAEFAWSLPPELVYRDDVTKWVLREAVRGLVPDVVLRRSDKVGFETPEAAWLGSPAGRSRIGDILLDDGAAGGLDRTSVERDLAAGAWRDVSAVWRAVNVELWLRACRLSPGSAETTRT
jgi:asparagine synthase (glutamine-hydrolysing)